MADGDAVRLRGQAYVVLRRLNDAEVRHYVGNAADQDGADGGQGDGAAPPHRLFIDLVIAQPVVPPMEGPLLAEFNRLVECGRLDEMATLMCSCKSSAIITNELRLFLVNKALWRDRVGLLAYRVVISDSFNRDIQCRCLYTIYTIPAYPDRLHAVVNTNPTTLRKLRNVLKTVLGGRLQGGPLSVVHCTDLEGCILADRPPPPGAFIARRIPTTDGFVFSTSGVSEVVRIHVSPGHCAACQANRVAPVAVL